MLPLLPLSYNCLACNRCIEGRYVRYWMRLGGGRLRMIYLERRPGPALARFVRRLWYARDESAAVGRGYQRVLPNGCLQLILNLAEGGLTDCSGPQDRVSSPALVVGLQTRWQRIAEADLAELIGVIFAPGGFAALFPQGADAFSEVETCFESVDGRAATALRDRLRETATVAARFDVLEEALVQRLRRDRSASVDGALAGIRAGLSIGEVTRRSGLSARRLSELFRHHVGATPKVFARIERFQRTVAEMHRGVDIRWSELALDCGYYDQSHFANEFRAFSGVSPSEYSASSRPWRNHLVES